MEVKLLPVVDGAIENASTTSQHWQKSLQPDHFKLMQQFRERVNTAVITKLHANGLALSTLQKIKLDSSTGALKLESRVRLAPVHGVRFGC